MPRQFQYYQAPQVDLTRQYSDTVSAELAATEAFTRPLLVAMEGMIQQKIQRDRMNAQMAMQQQSMAHETGMEQYRQGETNKRAAMEDERARMGLDIAGRNASLGERKQGFEEAQSASDAALFGEMQPGGAYEASQLGPVTAPYAPPTTMMPGTSPSLSPTMVGPSTGLLGKLSDDMMRQGIERQRVQAKAQEEATKRENFQRYATGAGLAPEAVQQAMNRFGSDEPGAAKFVDEQVVQTSRGKEAKDLNKAIGDVKNRTVRETLLQKAATLNPRSEKFGELHQKISDAVTSGELPSEWKRDYVREYGKDKIDLEHTTFGTAAANRKIEEAVMNDPEFRMSDDAAALTAILKGGPEALAGMKSKAGDLWNKHAGEMFQFLVDTKKEMGLDPSKDIKGYQEWRAKFEPKVPGEVTKPGEEVKPSEEKPPMLQDASAVEKRYDEGLRADAKRAFDMAIQSGLDEKAAAIEAGKILATGRPKGDTGSSVMTAEWDKANSKPDDTWTYHYDRGALPPGIKERYAPYTDILDNRKLSRAERTAKLIERWEKLRKAAEDESFKKTKAAREKP